MNEKKKLSQGWVALIVLASLAVAFAIIFPIIYCTVLKVDLKIEASQVGDSQSILVKWDSSKPVDKVSISVYHGNDLVKKEVLSNFADTYAGQRKIDAFYGKLTVKVKIEKGIYATTEKTNVNVFTDEYVIAPITATLPVTMFTLSLDEVTNKGQIPTYVWFKRSGAWDWNSLPENVYPMPVADTDEFLSSGQDKMYEETSEWVKELYEMNKESKFHFYYNDYFAFGWLQATVANGIPASNYDVVLLSDGSGSFTDINKHYDNENAVAEYASMKAKYEKLKTQIAKNRSFDKHDRFAVGSGELREYAYLMANEESNVEWWLSWVANTSICPNNADFFNAIKNNPSVKEKRLSNMLKNIAPKVIDPTITDEDAENIVAGRYLTEEKLKKLYKFSDDMFKAAETQNKKIMIILGTWSPTKPNEPYLKEYADAVKALYGDDYVYYYKGHPKYPTNTVSGKLEQIESYGLIDVDSTIPAELLFFFNPTAVGSGYLSSTFTSLTDERCGMLFGHSKGETLDIVYKDRLDGFITKVDKGYNSVVTTDNCFLVEFNDTTNYDFAIFNADNNQLTYYKTNGSNFEVVTK